MKKQKRVMSGMLAGLMVLGTFFGTGLTASAKEEKSVTISLEAAEHGTLSFSDTDETSVTVPSGSKVTILATPEDGYQTDYISTVDENDMVSNLSFSSMDVPNKATLTADKPVTVISAFSMEGSELSEAPEIHEEALEVLEPEKTKDKEAMETAKVHILSDMDVSKTGKSDSLTLRDFIHVTATVVDGSVIPDATFDTLWSDADGDGLADHPEALSNQTVIYVPLYEASADADYYVGQVIGNLTDAKVTDWDTAMNNADAQMVDDIIFDSESGLVYVPKTYTKVTDESAKLMQTRIQLIITANLDSGNVSFPIRVNHEGVSGKLANTGISDSSLLAVTTDIQIAKNDDSLEDIKESTFDNVIINGVSYEDGEGVWAYNEESGILSIGIAPVLLTDVEIQLSETFGKTMNRMWENVKSFFSPEVKAASPPPSGETILPGEIKFPNNNFVGSTYYLDTSYIYHAKEHGGVGLSGYANPMVSISDSNSGGVEGRIALQALGSADVPLDLATTHMTNLHRSAAIPAQTVAGVQFPAMNVNLMCSHVQISIDWDTGQGIGLKDQWFNGRAHLYVKAVSGNYAIIGIVIPTVNTQAGGGFFKIAWGLSGGKARLQKFSANPEYTDGNSAYNLTGAKYGIFRDQACTSKICTLTVQNNTGVTDLTPLLERGTYYAKEEQGTCIGYTVNPHVQAFTIDAGNNDKLIRLDSPEMREPTIDDPISILVEKSFEDWDKQK